MRREYLLPVLLFAPLLIILLLLSQLEYSISPSIVAVVIVIYLVANVAYSVVKGIFHISILVELTLVSLIAYFVLTNLI